MALPDVSLCNWLVQASHNSELIGKDALIWRKAAQRDGIDLPPELGGVGRGIQKLQSKSSSSKILLGTSELAEMATQSSVSQYRFSSFFEHLKEAPLQVVVPAAGAGLDSLSLLQQSMLNSSNLLVSDIDPMTLWFCKTNLQQCFPHRHGIFSFCCDALKLPTEISEQSYCFMDPARRKAGQRLEDQYLPPLDDCIHLLQKFKYAQIKLSPGASIHHLTQQYPDWSWEMIQMGSEIKEICGSYGATLPNIKATQLDHEGNVISNWSGKREDLLPAPLIEQDLNQLVLIPEPALRQSGLLQLWCQHFDVQATAYEQVFQAKSSLERPLCKTYQLRNQSPAKPSALKDMLKNIPNRIVFRSLNVKPDVKLQKVIKPHVAKPAHHQPELCLLLARSQNKLRALLLEPISS